MCSAARFPRTNFYPLLPSMNVFSCFSPARGMSGPLKGHAVPDNPATEAETPHRIPCRYPESQRRRVAPLPEKQACSVPGTPALRQKKRSEDAGRDCRTFPNGVHADQAAAFPPARSSAQRPSSLFPVALPLLFLKKHAVCRTPAVASPGLFPGKNPPHFPFFENNGLFHPPDRSRTIPFLFSAGGDVRPLSQQGTDGGADTKNTSPPLFRPMRGLLKTLRLRYEQLVCSFSVRKKERTGRFRSAKKGGRMAFAAAKGCVILKQYDEIIQYSRGASLSLPPCSQRVCHQAHSVRIPREHAMEKPLILSCILWEKLNYSKLRTKMRTFCSQS